MTSAAEHPRLVSRNSTGDRLGVGRTTVLGLEKEGEIETVSIGRRILHVESSVDAYVARLRGEKTPEPVAMAPVDDMVVEAAQIAATRGQRIDTYADAQLGLPVHVLRGDSV